jgi:hypothetical protein
MELGRLATTLIMEELKPILKRNEVKEVRNYKQLEKLELNFDSPRMKKAMFNLGVGKEECLRKYLNVLFD